MKKADRKKFQVRFRARQASRSDADKRDGISENVSYLFVHVCPLSRQRGNVDECVLFDGWVDGCMHGSFHIF